MDEKFHSTAVSYLVILAVACLICSIYIHPLIMLFVWVATAAALGMLGRALDNRKPPRRRDW